MVKLDMGIVRKITTNNGTTVISAIIDLVHHLNSVVVCEGVENKHDKDTLMAMGCDLIQGYYYSHVYPEDEPSVDRVIKYR